MVGASSQAAGALLITDLATVKGKSSQSSGSFLISRGPLLEVLCRLLSPEDAFLPGDFDLLSILDNLAAMRSFLRCSSLGNSSAVSGQVGFVGEVAEVWGGGGGGGGGMICGDEGEKFGGEGWSMPFVRDSISNC